MILRTPTLLRIANVPVRVHWSWPAALAAVVAALGALYAGAAAAGETLIAAAGVGLLLGVSVVLHELGHALTARRFGLPVRSITLVALGGYTEIAEERSDPVQELLVALAGPAASAALALLGALAWWASPWPLVGLAALHLALTNTVIAALNMLPCLPLDGGRVLRAVFWFLRDDELAGARLAQEIGRGCGWLVASLGLFHALTSGDLLNGLWIALGGCLLSRATVSGYQQFVLRRVLRGVRVAEVMQRSFRAVTPEMRLDHFVGRYVLGQSDQSFPVVGSLDYQSQPALLGMITVRNLSRFTLSQWPLMRVREAMTPVQRLRVLTPDTPASDAFRALLESREDQLPVSDGQTLLGVLRRRDLPRHLRRFVERLR
jgi:Zn-dependent protease